MCFCRGSDRILVTYGGINLNESQKAYVKALTRHPDYEPVELLNDVAVFSLMEDLEFSRFVKPICLPDSSLSPRKLVNSYAVVAGYGALYDIDALQRKGLNASQADTRVLMRTSLRILDDRICYKRYYDKKTGSSHFHPGYQMCTYEKDTDTCVGDSGGALTVRLGGRFYQVGIVSGGRECASYYPGVYANVFNYIDWIVKAVEFLS
ncbi:brain-specific serine protease 4-like [Tropilaelaps mercedesae]|uniref:Brain-specific serine protease 4-like n=1 Tax=Tropilaelaps mercedesae TaxID=418985 RepID=A0A1V9XTM8_9ACAR|nr:brain-specific serine protease 4-like [Tropilaelaps mercedesae]